MCVQKLSDLLPGECCVIKSIGDDMLRFRELGLHPGAVVRCETAAPSGSPIGFWISGALIALRRSDCKNIGVDGCG